MVDIRYMKSDTGEGNFFMFIYKHSDYIPEIFFHKNKHGYGSELYFLIALLSIGGVYDCKEEHCHKLIHSTHYDCFYKDIPFTMIYDTDYDIVSFSVLPDYVKHIKEIAEYICGLIENDGIKLTV